MRCAVIKLTSDLINAKTGKAVMKEGDENYPAQGQAGRRRSGDMCAFEDEALVGQYLAALIFLMKKPDRLLFEAGHEVTEEDLAVFAERKVEELPILSIDHLNVGPYIRNTDAD